MAFRVQAITDRTLKGLARKLEVAMNAAHEKGAQVVRLDKQGRGFLLITFEEEPAADLAQAAIAAVIQAGQSIGHQERKIPPACLNFMLKVSGLINASSKAEFNKELPNAVLRAMRQLAPGEAQTIQADLEAWFIEHRKGGCTSCKDSEVAELVATALKQQLSSILC